jgi:hypothetical protein
LFRRLFLQMLVAAHDAGRLQFFGDHVPLADKAAFKLIFYSADSQAIERTWKFAPAKRLGTTFPVICRD